MRQSARLTIIGRDPPSWLLEAAQRDSRIQVTGWVDDVRPYIEGSACYVCPIFDGGGTKLKVLDALSMGIPLVASPTACEGISVTDGMNVIFANTAKEFAQQIEQVWDEPQRYESIGIAGNELIRSHYDIAAIGRELAMRYQELGTRHTPPVK